MHWELEFTTYELKGKKVIQGTFRDITDERRADEALQQRTHDLGERVKELKCLYGISGLVENPDISLDEILRRAADLIPPAWQYPEITCGRIILEGKEFQTENFRETASKQAAKIDVQGQAVGSIEVYYLEEKPESHEGPFLKEERSLIDAVARQLGSIIERKQAEEEIQRNYDTQKWSTRSCSSHWKISRWKNSWNNALIVYFQFHGWPLNQRDVYSLSKMTLKCW